MRMGGPAICGRVGIMVVVAIGVAAPAIRAAADPVEDFYKGKTVTIVTSTGVGGPFDLTARSLA